MLLGPFVARFARATFVIPGRGSTLTTFVAPAQLLDGPFFTGSFFLGGRNGCSYKFCDVREQFAQDIDIGADKRLAQANFLLQATSGPHLPALDKRDDNPALAGAGSTPGAVDIGLMILGWIEVDHRGNAIDMDSSGGHIGGDECMYTAFFEVAQGIAALALAASTVDRYGRDPVAHQLFGQAVGAVAGSAKHNGRAHGLNRRGCQGDALGLGDLPKHMRGGRNVGGFFTAFVARRVGLVIAGQLGDIAVEGCREQHGLAVLGGLVEQAAHGGGKPHVGHAIGFVQDDVGNGL